MRKLYVLAALLVASGLRAETQSRQITLAAVDADRTNAVVRLAVSVPQALARAGVSVTGLGDKPVVGQLLAPGLLLDQSKVKQGAGDVVRELVFVAPKLAKGAATTVTVTLDTAAKPAGPVFAWTDSLPDWSELRLGTKPVMRYIRAPLSPDKAKRFDTMKVFHHVYDPDRGETLLTNGVGAKLFPHHRGVMYGFNKTSYVTPGADPKTAKNVDIWHCPVAYQLDGGTVSAEGGPVVGRHCVKIEWHGQGTDLFANELREVSIIDTPGGMLMDWASRLEATQWDVTLDGDPQHAGFHFRANSEVADATAKQTYYLRPDGRGKLDETRNWPGNKEHINLPWDAMCFLLGGQRYTVAYLDRPTNPKEARFSERDYGRFGSYFKVEVTKDKPLDVGYRLWVQSGEMTGEQVAALSTDFVNPVVVK